MKVYLAGPITGLTYDGASDWRSWAKAKLKEAGLSGYSPLRAKEYLRSEGILSGSYDKVGGVYSPFSTASAILTRDRWDVMSCDVMLVNFIGATQISIGTVIEIAFADAFRKPVIMAYDPENHIHRHPMLDHSIGLMAHTLPDAVQMVIALLTPG